MATIFVHLTNIWLIYPGDIGDFGSVNSSSYILFTTELTPIAVNSLTYLPRIKLNKLTVN